MKKLSFVLSAAALFALASCQQAEIAVPEQMEGSTFSIIPTFPETRTSLDGDTFQVEWEADDVIYAVTTDEAWGKPYVDKDNSYIETIAEFKNDGTGKFSTTSKIASGSHTFNFLYAGADQKTYHRGAGTTYSLSPTQTQTGSSTDHIKTLDALVGTLTATAPLSSDASVTMSHVFSLMKVNVTNASGKTITPTSLAIEFAGATVAGVFPVDFTTSTVGEATKNANSTITVKFKELTIAAGASVPVYFVIAPLSNYSGKVTFTLTDSDNKTYTKSSNVSKVSFEAGKYNTASVSFSQGVGISTVTVAQALTKVGDGKNYQLTGVCKNIQSTVYGNFDLVDETGSIYIYGLLTADGQSKQFASLDIEEGDTVTLTGTVIDYNGTTEIKNATFVSRVKGEKIKTFALANTTPSTSVGAAATSATFTVKSTAKWTAKCSSGMTADPSSFAGSDQETSTKVTLSFPANTSTSAKTYTCTVTTTDNVSGDKTLTFTVNQAAAENISGSSTLDKITHGAIGVEGSYAEWSKTGASGASYSGITAGGTNNDVIQMNSNKLSSGSVADKYPGIVVNSSSKYVKSVTIKWAPSDDTYKNVGKAIDVFGSMTTLSATNELWNIANTVSKVGQGKYDEGTTSVITFDKNYKSIGIRANSGAIYIQEIDIEWSTSKVGEDPTVSLERLAKPVLTVENITETSFDVTWTAVANAKSYSVNLDGNPYGDNDGVYPGTTTKISFNGLEAGSTHTVTVKAVADHVNYDDSTVSTITTSTKSTAVAGQEEIVLTGTFTYDETAKTLSLTDHGITIVQKAGDGNAVNKSYNTAGSLRVYRANTLTISSSSTILKIEFIHEKSYAGSTAISATPGSYSRGETSSVWTGSAKSVTITNGATDSDNVQFRPTQIKVTIKK